MGARINMLFGGSGLYRDGLARPRERSGYVVVSGEMDRRSAR
jgi:hypothetical protein